MLYYKRINNQGRYEMDVYKKVVGRWWHRS
jgi:hypothetical protein